MPCHGGSAPAVSRSWVSGGQRQVYSTVPPRHLYIHVPFCARRCSYCDFSIAVRRVVPVSAYLDALRAELWVQKLGRYVERSAFSGGRHSPTPPDQSALETVYVGGGTPSRLGAEGIRELLAIVGEVHPIAPGAEITIEVNPDDISARSLEAWAAAGVNRLSIGVQTFDDSALEWMHRTHSAEQSLDALRLVRQSGIHNFSIDLIFALPLSLSRSWKDDVDRVLAFQPAHISLYGLTVEPSTPLARWTAAGITRAAPDDCYADEFLYAHDAATAAGYDHYEVSNFALPGSQSRHNSAYWSGASYIGAGPSAHSFDGACRSWNIAPYAAWAARLEAGQSVTFGEETLTEANRLAEKVYLGLRTAAGLTVQASDLEAARAWVAQGWAVLSDARVRLTPEGWLRLDTLAAGLTGI